MIPGLENKVDEVLSNLNGVAKWFFEPEIQEIEWTREKVRSLNSNYIPDQNWYIDYGMTVNRGFSAAYSAVNRFYDLHEALDSIPLVGGFFANLLANQVTKKLGPAYALLGREDTISWLDTNRTFLEKSMITKYNQEVGVGDIQQQLIWNHIPYGPQNPDPHRYRNIIINGANGIARLNPFTNFTT